MEEYGEIMIDGVKIKRNFKVIYRDIDGNVIIGKKFIGTIPLQAAKKAGKKLYDYYNFNNLLEKLGDTITYCLYETTRGYENRKFWYVAKMEKKEPKNLYKIPKEYIDSYNNSGDENSIKIKKIILSEKDILNLGGFEKIYNKSKEDVKPDIIFDKKINVTPIIKQTYKKIVVPDSFFWNTDDAEKKVSIENIVCSVKIKKPKNKK